MEIKIYFQDTESPATSCPIVTTAAAPSLSDLCSQGSSAGPASHWSGRNRWCRACRGSRCAHKQLNHRAAPGRRGQELGNPWFIIWDRRHSNRPRSRGASRAGSLPGPAEAPEGRLARLEPQVRPRQRRQCHDELRRNEPGEPAGSWRGREAELDTFHQLPPGKRPEEQEEPEPCQGLMLPGWRRPRHYQASRYFPPNSEKQQRR